MKLLDLTLASPAENLACDEALLDWCEAGAGEEVLRFWEPQEYFVVVGYANKVATEVNVAAGEARGIPVLRRCSGGGTVLQGPGCLNYTLILKIEAAGPFRNISSANQIIMERNRAALEDLLARSSRRKEAQIPSPLSRKSGQSLLTSAATEQIQDRQVVVCGHTDLTIEGLKFSGNSQRRHRRFLLFHGTFLVDLDITLVEALLSPPSKQPDYRRNRSHGDFLMNLNVPPASVRAALTHAWKATAPLVDFPRGQIEILAREKYATLGWTFRSQDRDEEPTTT